MVRLPCGGVAGASGDSTWCQKALNWLEKPKGKPPKLKDCVVMVAYGDGRTGYFQDKDWTFIPFYDFHAIGSGEQAALGAMARWNATAAEAVETSAQVDPNTSAPIDVMVVEAKAPKRRNRGRK